LSYVYAIYVLKAPFPLGEAAIATSSQYSFHYAKYIKGRFILGEPAIAQSLIGSLNYAKDILKAPFPLGEKIMSENRIIYKQYRKLFPKKPKPSFFTY